MGFITVITFCLGTSIADAPLHHCGWGEFSQRPWPTDARLTLAKYPQLIDYGYIREIGEGNLLFKVMFGTPGKNIR